MVSCIPCHLKGHEDDSQKYPQRLQEWLRLLETNQNLDSPIQEANKPLRFQCEVASWIAKKNVPSPWSQDTFDFFR